MVEFAILVPVLFGLVCGSVDFGRVFSRNSSILGAAREAARRAVYYDPTTQTNPYFTSAQDLYLLQRARDELGLDPSDTTTLQFLIGHENDCFTPASPPQGDTFYPPASKTDTGYMFICWPGTPGADGAQHVVVTITWTMSIVTPLIQSMVGTPHMHAIVEMTQQTVLAP